MYANIISFRGPGREAATKSERRLLLPNLHYRSLGRWKGHDEVKKSHQHRELIDKRKILNTRKG